MFNYFIGKLKQISLLTLFTFILLCIYFVRSHTAPGSTDSYWHLSLGRQIWQQKSVPSNDGFVYGSSRNEFYLNRSTEWLSSFLMYVPVHILGLKTIYLERIFFGLGIIFFIYLTIKIFIENNLLTNTALIFLGYVITARLSLDRVENFSLLSLTLINYICFYQCSKKRLSKLAWLLPLVFLAWPNMHPFVVVGYVILSFWTAWAAFSGLKYKVFDKSLKLFLSIALISLLVATLQFSKTFYFSQVNLVGNFDVGEMDSITQRLGKIKMDYINQIPFEIYGYVIVLLILFVLQAVYLFKKPKNYFKHAQFAIYFAIFLIPFKYFRYISASIVIIFPYLFSLITKANFNKSIFKYALATVYLVILSLTVGSVLVGHVLGWRQYWRYNQDAKGNYIAVRNFGWTEQFPPGIPSFIFNNLNSRRIFTSKLWDNYFLWYLPGTKTFSDSLWDFRTAEDLKNEGNLSAGTENWQELIHIYNIDTVVNSQYDSIYDNFTPVYRLPNWKLVYVDSDAIVYARSDVIEKLPVDLSKIQAQKAYYPLNLSFDTKDEDQAVKQLHDLIGFDNKNAFARSQLVLYYLNNKNDLEAATKLAVESRSIIPKDPIFSFYMSVINARQNKCDLALNFAREMQQKSYNDMNLKQSVNAELSRCSVAI